MVDYNRVANLQRLLQGKGVKQHAHPSPSVYQPYSNDPFSKKTKGKGAPHRDAMSLDAEKRKEHRLAMEYLHNHQKPTMNKVLKQHPGMSKGAAMRIVHDYQLKLKAKLPRGGKTN
jgi:hypothetical protein